MDTWSKRQNKVLHTNQGNKKFVLSFKTVDSFTENISVDCFSSPFFFFKFRDHFLWSQQTGLLNTGFICQSAT